MRPQPRYHPGDLIGGTYLVMQPALMGGMGEIYLCLTTEKPPIPVALKTFQQGYLAASGLRKVFEGEVFKWVQLQKHPNIVRCYQMEFLDDQPFMVLEWINGGDLSSKLRRQRIDSKVLELEEALSITIDICRGLTHAEQTVPGIVHRDLKPGNIMLHENSFAKITDFGLAAISQEVGLQLNQADDKEHTPGQSLMQAGGVAGTPPFMPPEQWDAGQVNQLSQVTDLYALGCILYEMLTGEKAFQLKTKPKTTSGLMSAYRERHTNGPRPILPENYPASLRTVVSRCLDINPTKRPVNATVLMEELVDIYKKQVGAFPPSRQTGDIFTAADYNNRGVTYSRLNRHTEAIADFDRVIQLEPDDAWAYSNRGYSYGELGQHKRAIIDYDRAIQLDPANAKIYCNRGNSYDQQSQHQRAIADYNRAIHLDPALAEAYLNRGKSYTALDEYQWAIADFDRVIQLDPNYAMAYNNRGVSYDKLGQPQRALADYERAIQVDPGIAMAYINRGNIYAALGQPQRALSDYNRAIHLDPDYAMAYSNRGNIYTVLGQPQRALSDCNRAIQLNPTLAQAYNNRGNSYSKLGQPQRALEDYERAIELDSTFAMAYLNKGAVLGNQGKHAEAIPYFERAYELGDPDGAQYAATARKMMAKGQPKIDPEQAAFKAFVLASNIDDMRAAVTQHPSMRDSDFIQAMEQFIAIEVPPELKPVGDQLLAWLKQIAKGD